jgi:FtsP/CotA-like multicopper oxidase with cupredoxin domain
MGNLLGACPCIRKYFENVEVMRCTNLIAQGQYVDGLRAPLVIHAEKEVHTYDEEFTVVLGDWYHTEHSELIKQFISIANPGGAEPVPGS